MKKFKIILLLIITFCWSNSYSQKVFKLHGVVFDEYLIPFSKAKVRTSEGEFTITDEHGTFKISASRLPVKIILMEEGFQREEVTVLSESEEVSLIIKEDSGLNEMVVSASRTPEKIFESPVTVSRIGTIDMKKSASVNFYEGLENIGGLSMYNASVLNKMINTRGFTNMNNLRFVQLVDGVDNVYSHTEMFYGNIFGPNELDVASVELLPGASSALYGPNAYNGVLLMNTKSPFEHTGITVDLKSGVTTSDENQTFKPFYNPSARLAYRFDKSFAAKVNFSLYYGDEWMADDYRDINDTSINGRNGKADYNGINIYGDEHSTNLKYLAYKNYLSKNGAVTLADIVNSPNVNVTRTGYKEEFLTSQKAGSRKFDAGLYYRPFGDESLEVNFMAKSYLSDTHRQISDVRYTMNDSKFVQYILGLKGEDFFFRAIRTKTDFGNYHAPTASSILIDLAHMNDDQWISQYQKEFTPMYNNLLDQGYSKEEASRLSDIKVRDIVDAGRLLPGSPKFNSKFSKLTNTFSKDGGTKYYVDARDVKFEGQWDLSKYVKVADIIIGGSYKDIVTDSKGFSYTDKPNDLVDVDSYGLYTQAKKNILDNRLKLMGSLRYDKSQNFEGNFSPRIASNVVLGENRNHNVRFSYQTAFRNPTVENQYIGIRIGLKDFVVGNLEENFKRFDKVDLISQKRINYDILTTTGFDAKTFDEFINRTLSELKDSSGAMDILLVTNKHSSSIKTINLKENPLKAEDVQAFELGYRGLFNVSNNIFEVEGSTYFNIYENFISKKVIYIPYYGDVTKEDKTIQIINRDDFDVNNISERDAFTGSIFAMGKGDYTRVISAVNSKDKIYSYGGQISIKTKVFDRFDLKLHYNYTDFSVGVNTETSFKSEFNSPKHSIKTSFGNQKLFKNIGFSVAHRWQTAFQWNSPYGSGIIQERSVFDAQVTCLIPSIDSRIKLGANNIFGKKYLTAIGAPATGSIYYLSLILND